MIFMPPPRPCSPDVAAPRAVPAPNFTAPPPDAWALPPDVALQSLESLDEFVEWLPLSEADEARVIRSAPARGIQGRILYDALIAECAVKAGRKVMVTANPTHFRHVLRTRTSWT